MDIASSATPFRCPEPLLNFTLHEPLGVVGQITPWNSSAAGSRLEIRACAGGRLRKSP